MKLSYSHLQVKLCQKLLFLNQLTHNMTRDCSLNPPKNTSSEHVVYKYCFECQKQYLCTTCSPRFELGIFMYSMNNLSSYYGLVDAKIRASDKDLPVLHLFILPEVFKFSWITVHIDILF